MSRAVLTGAAEGRGDGQLIAALGTRLRHPPTHQSARRRRQRVNSEQKNTGTGATTASRSAHLSQCAAIVVQRHKVGAAGGGGRGTMRPSRQLGGAAVKATGGRRPGAGRALEVTIDDPSPERTCGHSLTTDHRGRVITPPAVSAGRKNAARRDIPGRRYSPGSMRVGAGRGVPRAAPRSSVAGGPVVRRLKVVGR